MCFENNFLSALDIIDKSTDKSTMAILTSYHRLLAWEFPLAVRNLYKKKQAVLDVTDFSSDEISLLILQ